MKDTVAALSYSLAPYPKSGALKKELAESGKGHLPLDKARLHFCIAAESDPKHKTEGF